VPQDIAARIRETLRTGKKFVRLITCSIFSSPGCLIEEDSIITLCVIDLTLFLSTYWLVGKLYIPSFLPVLK
jgi:hypothetical protein